MRKKMNLFDALWNILKQFNVSKINFELTMNDLKQTSIVWNLFLTKRCWFETVKNNDFDYLIKRLETNLKRQNQSNIFLDVRNVWIQKISKNNRNFVSNNIFTKFLNNSSKSIDIRISIDKKFDRFWRDWFNCRISKTECKTTKKKFETTIAIMICLIFSLNFSISRCLIWKKRWNSCVFEMKTDDTKLLIEINLNELWKVF